MNIAITLPRNLWEKICSGEKQIECRKRIPRNFMPAYDLVWVIIKGTNKVVGALKINTFQTCVEVQEIARNYLDKICIDKTRLEQYAKHEDVLHLWHIKETKKLAIPQDREKFLDIMANPQCYTYCRPNGISNFFFRND